MILMNETLAKIAWRTYLDAGGQLLGQPGMRFYDLSVDYIAAWMDVGKHVNCLAEQEVEIAATALAKELSDKFYHRIAGAVVFKEFTRQPIAEQIAWEAVARQCYLLAASDEEKDEAIPRVSWSEWARDQFQKRGSLGVSSS